MIPFVSLGCGWGGSLSQLSLDGLKLPGQVYSAVTPWAGGAGSLSPGQPSESVTLWPPILASLLPCIHLFNSATTYFWLQQNESLLTELQTPLTLISFSDFNWLQLLSNTHTLLLLYYRFFINVWSRPALALTRSRQKQTGCNAASVSHYPHLLLAYGENTMLSSHVVASHL